MHYVINNFWLSTSIILWDSRCSLEDLTLFIYTPLPVFWSGIIHEAQPQALPVMLSTNVRRRTQ